MGFFVLYFFVSFRRFDKEILNKLPVWSEILSNMNSTNAYPLQDTMYEITLIQIIFCKKRSGKSIQFLSPHRKPMRWKCSGIAIPFSSCKIYINISTLSSVRPSVVALHWSGHSSEFHYVDGFKGNVIHSRINSESPIEI